MSEPVQMTIDDWLKEKEPAEDYIKENPTCFYVHGYYLDRSDGWRKLPAELPVFNDWTIVDVVLFGKKTGTSWMEHGKWEAKHWAFRSIGPRKGETDMLAWKKADSEG